MGKYDDVIDGLPSLTKATPRDERVRELMSEFHEKYPEIPDLAYEFAMERAKKAELDKQASIVKERIEALTVLLVNQFESDQIRSVKLSTTGQTVSVRTKPHAVVKDKEAFRLWCIAEGMVNEMHLHPSTTGSLVKERLLQGEAEPDGIEAYMAETLYLAKK